MNGRSASLRSVPWLVLIVASALVLVAVPIWQLIGPGPFDWHIRLPQFWQGGLEALVLAASLAAGFAWNRRIGWLVLVAVPTAFYLRRHAIDVPLLIDLVYLEIVIGLGMAVRRVLRLPAARGSEDYLHAFVLGFLVWSLAAWTLSALGLGSISQLRALTLLLAIPACWGRNAPFLVYVWRGVQRQEPAVRTWCGLLAAWIAILFARSNVVVGYDPIWYGLRPEHVLDPGHSLFQPLGLVSPVYYFPKLYETFLLPLSRLHDFSVVDGVAILLLPLIALTCLALMRRLAAPARVQWPILAAIVTLPALANTAIGPKPDVISTLFLLLAALAALDAAQRRDKAAATWMLGCAMLACIAKLTAIPYAGALVLTTLIAAWRAKSPATSIVSPYSARMATTALAAALIVGGFVTARTWSLTGMPTIGPDPLVSLWRLLGMELREPSGTLRWTYPMPWSLLPEITFDVLLRPYRDVPHMVITWVGNLWLWLALIAAAGIALRAPRARIAPQLPLFALIAVGLYVFFGVNTGVRGNDGNYFLYALVPAIVVAASAAFDRLRGHARAFTVALACVPLFVAFHASYSFVSAGWSPGTMAFDTDLSRTWRDRDLQQRQTLEASGLSRIGAYLKELPGNPRLVGNTEQSSGYWLPARYESVYQINLARPDYLTSASAFRRFLRTQSIEYLVAPLPQVASADAEPTPPAFAEAAAELEALPGTKRIDDRRHYLLDLSAVTPEHIDPSMRAATP